VSTVAVSGSASATSAVEAPYPPYRGLWAEEDVALEQWLSGLVVPDAKGRGIKVRVFWREPQREETRLVYPHIMLDKLGISRRADEEHRGEPVFSFEPNTGNPNPAGQALAFWPIPIMVDYQVTTAAANFQHDVMINDIFATSKLLFHFGQLPTPSGVIRRLVVNGGPTPADTLTAEGGRVFRKVWDVSVSAEIVSPYQYGALVEGAEVTVETLTITVPDQVSPSFPVSVEENPGT